MPVRFWVWVEVWGGIQTSIGGGQLEYRSPDQTDPRTDEQTKAMEVESVAHGLTEAWCNKLHNQCILT
eukprot:6475351-Amphidinium_carterae.1